MIRTLEELSMNAWPALQTLHYGGWVLRSANGYTKRANSVHPLYDSDLDQDEKIGICETFYRERGLPTVFKMTGSSAPADLDVRLAARGYRAQAYTSVQLMDLRRGTHPVTGGVDLRFEENQAWHAAHARMTNMNENLTILHEGILRAILPDKCYASISVDGQIIGCGLGVLQAGYLGLFDILIDPDQRGQGHGERLMDALLAWGVKQGALSAYLQVMCDNGPALRLYEKLGFEERYQYWYRIKPAKVSQENLRDVLSFNSFACIGPQAHVKHTHI